MLAQGHGQYQVDSVHQIMLLVGQSTRHECVTFKLTSCRNAGAILFACPLLHERMSESRYGVWRIYDSEHRHTAYPETIQSRIFTRFIHSFINF